MRKTQHPCPTKFWKDQSLILLSFLVIVVYRSFYLHPGVLSTSPKNCPKVSSDSGTLESSCSSASLLEMCQSSLVEDNTNFYKRFSWSSFLTWLRRGHVRGELRKCHSTADTTDSFLLQWLSIFTSNGLSSLINLDLGHSTHFPIL